MFEIIDVAFEMIKGMCFDMEGEEIFPCVSCGSTNDVVCFTTDQSFVLIHAGKQIVSKPNIQHDWVKFPCKSKGKK